MLWGVALSPGRSFSCTIDYDVHLSMAALETRKGHVTGKLQEQSQVILQTDQGQFVICTLASGSLLQQNLNMRLTAGENVTIFSEGKATIHLTGNAILENSVRADRDESTAVLTAANNNVSSKDEPKEPGSDIDSDGEDCWKVTDVVVKEEPMDSDGDWVLADEENGRLTPEDSNNGDPCQTKTSLDIKATTEEETNRRNSLTNSTDDGIHDHVNQAKRRRLSSKRRAERGPSGCNNQDVMRTSCGECRKSFKSEALLKRHMASHREDRPHKCPTCHKGFKSSSALQVHVRTHTGEKPYECQTCMKSFADLGTLRRHEKIHSGETPFHCDYCGKGFPEKAPLVRHVRIHTGEKPFPCPSCPKRFSDKGQLKRHERSHLQGAERAVYNGQCDVCGKVLQDASSLRKHSLLHTDLKPYICEVCSKAFNDQSTLRQHLKMHARLKKQQPHFLCIFCSAEYPSIDELEEHKRACTANCRDDRVTVEIENVALIPVIKEEVA